MSSRMAACGQPPVSTARMRSGCQRLVADEELAILPREDVVGHGGEVHAVAQPAAQLQHQRRLAAADRPADADGERPPRVIPVRAAAAGGNETTGAGPLVVGVVGAPGRCWGVCRALGITIGRVGSRAGRACRAAGPPAVPSAQRPLRGRLATSPGGAFRREGKGILNRLAFKRPRLRPAHGRRDRRPAVRNRYRRATRRRRRSPSRPAIVPNTTG